jgi:putative FmdB family regulatory protein
MGLPARRVSCAPRPAPISIEAGRVRTGRSPGLPLYEYRCLKCGHKFELIRKFSDPPVTSCIKCSGKVEKLMSAPAIAFKGSGWYVTDYGGKSGGTDTGKGESKPDSESAKSESEAKSDAKSDARKKESGSTESKESSSRSRKKK